VKKLLLGTASVLLALALAPRPAVCLQTFPLAEPAMGRYGSPEQVAGIANEVRWDTRSLTAMTSPSCYVSPTIEKTYIFIRELDSNGNPLGQLGGGWVGFADQVPVISGTGKIVISYRKSSSDREYKMDPANCRGGNLISVP
jgi:hypothetical protein